MDDNRNDIPNNSSANEEMHLQRLLNASRQPAIDNTRIKQRVHSRILAEQARRSARMRRMLVGWLSAAACVALLVTVAVHLLGQRGSSLDLSEAGEAQLAEAGYTELTVPAGQRAEVMLADGSRLVANANTRVLYPDTFEGNERRIYACGEVYLEVAKDRNHPFVVESDHFDVKVLGTRFNINNSSDSTASVVLVEGSVEVTTSRDVAVRMSPDHKLTLANGEVESLTQVDTADYISWIEGLLTLNGERMDDVAERLSKHYGIDIQCYGELAGTRLYGKLDLRDSVEQVLATISGIIPMNVTVDDNVITLSSDSTTQR